MFDTVVGRRLLFARMCELPATRGSATRWGSRHEVIVKSLDPAHDTSALGESKLLVWARGSVYSIILEYFRSVS